MTVKVVFHVLVVLFAFGCGGGNNYQGNIVFTQLSSEEVDFEKIETGNYQYSPKMKIMMGEQGETLKNIKALTEEFNSARAAEISYDGMKMVFSGQKNEGDAWQIWYMDLNSNDYIQVTEGDENCTDPAWLPDGRIVYSKQINENDLKHHALFTISPDGCCEQRISFQPHDDLNANVLEDGRIIFSSQQLYPEPGDIKLLVMRPDGTKAELFYQPETADYVSEAVEDGHGKVVFAESGVMMAVNFSRPLHSRTVLTNDFQANSLDNLGGYNLVASIKKANHNTYGLAMYNQDDLFKELFYFDDSKYHFVDVSIVQERAVPRKLPSRVNVELETGYFVCMDANESEMAPKIEDGQTAKVQILGIDNVIGETELAEDGSFYLELTADQPVRFQTVNESGEVVRGPSAWMWVRPNERRGCVGCHENRELAPENVVPKAIEKAPVAMIK